MKEDIMDRLREATRLTGSGRLMEATAAIQEVLRPGGVRSTEAIVAVDEAAERRSVAISLASIVKLPELPKVVRGLLDKVPLKDLVRSKAPTRVGKLTVPDGAQFQELSYTGKAGTRPYRLYVPASRTEGVAMPVVVMLHGCTQSPDDFAAGTRMNEVAEERGFLVLYPGQTGSANMNKCWNWFRAEDQRRGSGEPSIIVGMVEEVALHHLVDPTRIYVAGLSAGGAAAAVLGAVYPDVFAAVGVHSGLASGAARDMGSAFSAMRAGADGTVLSGPAVPVIVFQGDKDVTVSMRNANAVLRQASRDGTVRMSMHKGQVVGGHAYTRTVHADEDGRSLAEEWSVHGAGHAWSGGSAAGSYTDPRGPDATREMLRFFLENPRI